MNTYAKYCPNVFCAKCEEKHDKGDVIEITTRNGSGHTVIVFNLLLEKDGFYYYSVVREDGFDHKAWAERRADKIRGYAGNALSRADEYYDRSNKDSEFLSLGEPIKVGHHSERRHRKMIEDANKNMFKYVEEQEKAKRHEERVAYWEGRANEINLSMPESLEYYEHLVDRLT